SNCTLEDLSDRQATCLYRIVQEALTNCAKHAHAKHIEVRIKGDEDALSLFVRDDGAGFNPKTVSGKGLGLVGIEERVREMGGSVKLESRMGNGTQLHVSLPLFQEVRA
ncbi:MAG: histidine kinase, partial [Acidimicrobiia bacterium]|nr:histidine kinase [Acidimicrobiia bacterium]